MKLITSLLKNVAVGIFCVFIFLLVYFTLNSGVQPLTLLLRGVFPVHGSSTATVFYTFAETGNDAINDIDDMNDINDTNVLSVITPDSYGIFESVPSDAAQDMPMETIGETEPKTTEIPAITTFINTQNVIFQEESDKTQNNNPQTEHLTAADIEKLKDFEYLRTKFYTIDKRTDLSPADIDVDGFLSRIFTLNKTGGAKILILHTHSQEGYSDSENGLADGIFLVGDRLAYLLENTYGIKTMHDKTSYDIVDGKSSIIGAYERMEENVTRILEENPTIEVVIDLHRDGVLDGVKFVTDINGKPTAKIMFFNGISRLLKDGNLTSIKELYNPYVSDNLAFSFNLQLLANEMFPGFARKNYINAYRYSLHFKPKSLLVEVGAQTNTKEEALNAAELLAEMLAKILK